MKPIKDIISNIKDDIKKISIVLLGKRIVLNILLILLFFYFKKGINTFIENYLAYDGIFSNGWITFLLLIIIIIGIIGIYQKSIKDKYLPTLNHLNAISILFFSLLFFRLNNNEKKWIFSSDIILGFKLYYIDCIIVLLFSFLLFNIIRYIINLISNTTPDNENQLLNDDPIEEETEDKLNHNIIVEKTTKILLNEKHKKSLTIGLVGPWGNGKSSVLNLIKNKLIESNNSDILTVDFKPYLNHKEDDIINEFFISLSNELSKYNGKLSDILEEYSEKVTNLYDNKNVFSLIEEHVTSLKDKTANELYELINEMLSETNKKIVVFVDDLDRLNEKEILQILKLIRNTADFRNTIFIVAMDKQYVLSRLKDSSKILNTSFIDKFFQLEIYLPEIDKNDLKRYFVEELNKPFENMPLDFKDRVDKAINDNSLLFDDYIKNYRDIKRTVNQIRFDLTLFKEDYSYLNLKDFINFTFFKLKFPKVMEDLKNGKSDFLELDASSSTYNLIKIEQDNTETLNFYISNENYDISLLKGYRIYEQLLKEECKDDLSIDCKDKKLLVKTLAFLFGSENSIEGIDSIKNQNNFSMLMQQRIFKDYLTHSEFNALFSIEIINLKNYLNILKDNNKIAQLIKRLEFYRTNDENQIKTIIRALLLLYNDEKFEVYTSDLFRLLHLSVEGLSVEDKILKLNEENSFWIKENIFDNNEISFKSRIEILVSLWKSKKENNLWSLDEKYCKDLVLKLYEKYLNQFQNELWNVNDYSSYGIYHSIKGISFKEVNNILRDFWIKNNIELLCAQSTDMDPFDDFSFKLTDTVIEIFETKEKFIHFIENHKDKEEPAIKEFIELFNLLKITLFTRYLIYNFEWSQLMLDKINYTKSHPGRPKNNEILDLRQVFFESDNEGFIDMIILKINPKQFSFSKYYLNKKSYLTAFFTREDKFDAISDFMIYLSENEKILNFEKIETVGDKSNPFDFQLLINDEYYFKIISIQPPLENTTINYESY